MNKNKKEVFEKVLAIILILSVVGYILVIFLSNNDVTVFLSTLIVLVLIPLILTIFALYKIIFFESIKEVVSYAILIMLLAYGIMNFNLINLYKDIPYALNKEYSYVEGEVENFKTYESSRGGVSINFTINDILFKVDESDLPINFKEGQIKKVTYLPNSKYVIDVN